MTFGIITNVYAETCSSNYVQAVHQNMLSYSDTFTNGLNSRNKYIPNNGNFTIPSGITNLKGTMWYVITDTSNNSYYSNIDLQQTCSHFSWSSQTGQAMTITYQDGSTAQINANSFGFPICDTYNSVGQVYQVQQYQPDITTMGLRIIKTDTGWYSCNVDSNGNFDCPIGNGGTFNGFTFLFTLSKGTNVNVKYGFVSGQFYKCTNDTQQIINNQNQNATQQHNDITSDNITGNNSNDSINSISNSFSSSNDFILNLFTLPYNFITTIMNGVTDSCTPISLGTIFNYELVMPCINLNDWLGNVWTGIVDVVLAGMLSFAFRKRIHDFFFAIIRLDRNAANIGGVEIL